MGKRKTWTLEEKLEILKLAQEGDVVDTCREKGVSTATYYNWKKKHETHGEAGLKSNYDNNSKELKDAHEKIRLLQKLLAEKEVELEIQREKVKKKFGISRR